MMNTYVVFEPRSWALPLRIYIWPECAFCYIQFLCVGVEFNWDKNGSKGL